jgi:polyisoprenoid-binding protein YceI
LLWNEESITESSIEAEIDSSSVNSGEPQRDEQLRNADFLDVEQFPLMHFQSTHVSRMHGDALTIRGELTIHGVTRPVELQVSEISSATRDPWGGVRMAASATAKLSRKDFGLTWNKVLETGGLLVGDGVMIDLDVEFLKATN